MAFVPLTVCSRVSGRFMMSRGGIAIGSEKCLAGETVHAGGKWGEHSLRDFQEIAETLDHLD